MSRLGSSKGTRLGVVQNWYTVGLIKNKRNFLVKKDERFIDYVEQVLMQEKMHKVGLIYSHSEMINKGAEVIINIFLYDGPFEEFLDGMVVKKASIIRRLQRKKVRIKGLRIIKRRGIKRNLLKKEYQGIRG